MSEKNFVIFDAFKKVQVHIPSVFLLFIGENFRDQLDTNILHAQFEGKNFVDGLAIQIQHTTDHSDCQTSIRPHEFPHFGHIFVRFWRARSSRTRFIFHTLTAIQKCFIPPKNLCPWHSMLSISPFQFFVSFCCVFVKFDTKFDRATLLEISFLHFRNASLLHTLTQLAVKSDVLMLAIWNLHWSSSKNVCLGWCLRCGYSVASCRATHSVSLLFWRTTYMILF